MFGDLLLFTEVKKKNCYTGSLWLEVRDSVIISYWLYVDIRDVMMFAEPQALARAGCTIFRIVTFYIH